MLLMLSENQEERKRVADWRNVLITPQLINSCSGVNNDMPNEIQNFQLLQKSLIIFKSYYGATEV